MRTEGDHHQVSENVFNNLPAWEQEAWRALRDDFIGPYSELADTLAPHLSPEQRSQTEPRYKELTYIDGVDIAAVRSQLENQPFFPFVRNYGESWHRVMEPGQFTRLFIYYLDMIVRNLRAGDHHMAAKATGMVSHILCDQHPGDHIDPGVWLRYILPPPDSIKDRLSDCWGITTQEVDIPRTSYRPQLLGLQPAEAMFHFYHRYLDMMKRGLPRISQMLLAVYAGQPAEAQRILSASRLMGIEIISDFIHTAFCIAYDRFDPAEKATLERVDLTRFTPLISEMDYLYFHGPYTDGVVDFFANGPLQPRKLEPELLVVPPGKTQPVLEVVRPVLAVLPDSGCANEKRWARLVYELPDGCFRRFTCLAGMPPRVCVRGRERGAQAAQFLNGQGADLREQEVGRVAVRVLGDDQLLFERNPVMGGDPAVVIDVPLAGVKRLSLIVEGLHRNGGEFWLGHFVWGRPVLTKT